MIITDKAVRISGFVNMILGITGMWNYLQYNNTGLNYDFFMYALCGFAFVFGVLVLFKENKTK